MSAEKSLEKFFVDNECWLHPDVEIRTSKLGGTGVFAKNDLEAGDIVLKVPKSACLSPRTCGIANLLDEHDLDNIPGLLVAFLYERSLGEQSPWHEFFESLKPVIADVPEIPKFWANEEDRALLSGTEVEEIGGLETGEDEEVYEELIVPFFEENGKLINLECPSFEEFKQLVVVIASRAFEVDQFRELCLVPGACLFNHSDDPDLHFQTDFGVCPVCGDVYCDHEVEEQEHEHSGGCCSGGDHDHGHDEDDWSDESVDGDDESEREEEMEEVEDEDGDEDEDMEDEEEDEEEEEKEEENDDEEEDSEICDMQLQNDIKKGKEIFNTYGDLPNSMLLARYGFAIWNNSQEVVSLWKEAMAYAKKAGRMDRLKMLRKRDPELSEKIFVGYSDGDVSKIEWGPCVNAMLTLLLMTDQEYKKKVCKRHLDKEINKAKTLLLNSRLKRYEDGGMTSEEYKKVLPKVEGTKRAAIVVRGTEKKVIETALKTLK
ncbi:Ribosomal lysine N-methyltransferase 3 [Yarrowia sp. B02]|nr:Ribosomal lysine N-methyltransferase 3 [Yarrowia sp. B02]